MEERFSGTLETLRRSKAGAKCPLHCFFEVPALSLNEPPLGMKVCENSSLDTREAAYFPADFGAAALTCPNELVLL